MGSGTEPSLVQRLISVTHLVRVASVARCCALISWRNSFGRPVPVKAFSLASTTFLSSSSSSIRAWSPSGSRSFASVNLVSSPIRYANRPSNFNRRAPTVSSNVWRNGRGASAIRPVRSAKPVRREVAVVPKVESRDSRSAATLVTRAAPRAVEPIGSSTNRPVVEIVEPSRGAPAELTLAPARTPTLPSPPRRPARTTVPTSPTRTSPRSPLLKAFL